MTDESKAPPMNPEQAADLAALQAAAMKSGQAVQLENAQPGIEPRPELAAEISALLALASSALAPAFPSLKEIYTEQTTAAAGHAIAAVCQKHGWLQNGIGGKYAEELACAAVMLPLSWATYNGIVSDMASRSKESKNAEPSIGVQAMQETATISEFPTMTAAVSPEPVAA